MAFVFGAFLLFLIIVVVAWIVSMQSVSARDIAWLAGTPDSGGQESRVYQRYLARHRRHRVAGGVFGALFSMVIGIRWYASVSIGIGTGSPLSDLLFCTLGGVLIGALSAETFRLSEPSSTSIAASLAERAELPGPDVVRLSRTIVLVALGTASIVAVTGHGSSSLWVAVIGVAVAGFAEATRRAVTDRRRPILSDRAQVVDMRIRSFAASSVSLLQLAMTVLTLGWVLSSAEGLTNDALLLIQFFAVIGSLITTVVLLRRAAPRPSKHWAVSPT